MLIAMRNSAANPDFEWLVVDGDSFNEVVAGFHSESDAKNYIDCMPNLVESTSLGSTDKSYAVVTEPKHGEWWLCSHKGRILTLYRCEGAGEVDGWSVSNPDVAAKSTLSDYIMPIARMSQDK